MVYKKCVTFAVIGAGHRGTAYARYAHENPHLARVVAIAEPCELQRNQLVENYNIPPQNIFIGWKDLAKRKRLADAVIIATQDTLHAEPAVAFANLGYHILLEKPMATTEQDCQKIAAAAMENNIIFAVCHVLRYTRYTQQLKAMIDEGVIGELVSIQHLEPVGYWHYAHSFVRGNWRNGTASSPLLMSKSCHDLDWIRYMMNSRCIRISSFGNLSYFRKKNKPKNAGNRCTECVCESNCPYSACKIYLHHAPNGKYEWPVNVITSEFTEDGVYKALQDGPYGRCVYECDNNVVDHQVVNMLFENNKTAVFTVTGFTKMSDRKTRFFGTHGEIYGDGSQIEHFDFLSGKTQITKIDGSMENELKGHGGGDHMLMKNFVEAIAENQPYKILSGPKETLETHLMVFAAERARLQNCVVDL